MRKPYWKYFVVLYILISVINIISISIGQGDGNEAPFDIGSEKISWLLTSLLDLIPVAAIGIIVEYILRKFTNRCYQAIKNL